MLFAAKSRVGTAFILLFVFGTTALAARAALDLRWRLSMYPMLPAHLLLSLAGMFLCDGLVHGLLCGAGGERYRACYASFAAFFTGQRPQAMVAGGLLAAGEELLFRGAILEGLVSRLGLAPPTAIGVTTLLFGALHALPERRLLLFAVWAVGQGVILGSLYIATRSLLLVALVHTCHDMAGFMLLAHQRQGSGHRGS